jgi:putative phosphoesterase
MVMQKAGVIADTHLREGTQELAELLEGPFRDVETILHAGDITEMVVLESFGEKEVIAICGNMDSSGVGMRLPRKRVWEAGKFRIGLIHGWGGRPGIEDRIEQEFEDVDCIVYGHTHIPALSKNHGILFFNPGSFAGIFGIGKKSVGILQFGEAISGEIFYL